MNHSFDIEVAENYGIEAAIIIQNMQHWIEKNVANKTNQFDGYTWTYNSISAWGKIYKYMRPNTIKRVLLELVQKDVLVRGNYNKNPYDQTAWYAFKDESKWLLNSIPPIGGKTPMDSSKSDNGLGDSPHSITDINPIVKPNTSEDSTESSSNNPELFTDTKSQKPINTKRLKKEKKEAHPAFKLLVDHWLKVVHPGWAFSAQDGKALNGIIERMTAYSVEKSKKMGDPVGEWDEEALKKYHQPTTEDLQRFFEHFCKSLGTVSRGFYKSQTLTVLNSKFDGIIEEIRTGGQQQLNPNNPHHATAILNQKFGPVRF